MKTIEVVAAVIKDNNKILAARRGYGEFIDRWEFPGGKIETGESKEAALIREIHEELEAQISVDKFLITVEYQYPQFFLLMHCYLCSIKSGKIEMKEHNALRWLALNELDSVEWLPADIDVVKALKDMH